MGNKGIVLMGGIICYHLIIIKRIQNFIQNGGKKSPPIHIGCMNTAYEFGN